MDAYMQNQPDNYGAFEYHKENSVIRYFTKDDELVTYLRVFSVVGEGDWLHVAAKKSEGTNCNKHNYAKNKYFNHHTDELKYFLLNTVTGFYSEPMDKAQYIAASEKEGLRYKLKREPQRFKKLEAETIASICESV